MRESNPPLLGCAIAVMALAACSGASVTQSIQPQVELSLEAAPAGAMGGAPTVVTASADNAILSGIVSTPNPCYVLDAKIEAAGRDLTLTVTARSKPGICIQMLGSFAYRARVTGLIPGEYPTRVVYEYPDTGWESKTYDVRVRIP